MTDLDTRITPREDATSVTEPLSASSSSQTTQPRTAPQHATSSSPVTPGADDDDDAVGGGSSSAATLEKKRSQKKKKAKPAPIVYADLWDADVDLSDNEVHDGLYTDEHPFNERWLSPPPEPQPGMVRVMSKKISSTITGSSLGAEGVPGGFQRMPSAVRGVGLVRSMSRRGSVGAEAARGAAGPVGGAAGGGLQRVSSQAAMKVAHAVGKELQAEQMARMKEKTVPFQPQIIKSKEQWQSELASWEYRCLRDGLMEPEWFWYHVKDVADPIIRGDQGHFACLGCNTPILDAQNFVKFKPLDDSQSTAANKRRVPKLPATAKYNEPWLYFRGAIQGSLRGSVSFKNNTTVLEVHCKKCDGILGQVTDRKTRTMWINSACIKFKSERIRQPNKFMRMFSKQESGDL